jgi:hypothetical protein
MASALVEGHPVEALDALGKGGLDVGHHALDARLGRGREVMLDIEPAMASPSALLTAAMARLSRGRALVTPASVVLKKAKRSLSSFVGRTLAYWLT